MNKEQVSPNESKETKAAFFVATSKKIKRYHKARKVVYFHFTRTRDWLKCILMKG